MITRRDLLKGATAIPAIASYPSPLKRLMESAELIRPPVLTEGARVAVIAPASHLFAPDRYEQALERLTSLGFRPTLMPRALGQNGYLAGSDQDRAADFNAAFADSKYDAVWCVRGGYGCLRILPLIDYASISKNPKPLIGYSDITALHLAILKRSGVVTFHGPMPSSDFNAYAREELRKVVMTKEAAGVVGAPPPFDTEPGKVDSKHRVLTLASGTAEGPLIGGNLSLLTRLLGTPYEPDFEGRILFLEDVGEAAYRIDGMLAHLWLAGKLHRVAGIAFGRFTEDESKQVAQLPTETVLRDFAARVQIPVIFGLSVGHVADTTTLPYGVRARLDADQKTLTLLEAAVR